MHKLYLYILHISFTLQIFLCPRIHCHLIVSSYLCSTGSPVNQLEPERTRGRNPGSKVIPFRNSKLTMLMQDSLGKKSQKRSAYLQTVHVRKATTGMLVIADCFLCLVCRRQRENFNVC